MEPLLVAVAVPPRSPRKPKGQGAERREEILAHAQRLFAAHGVQTVSTRHIAEAVGISQPTLYAYFPTRSDLLEEVSARAFAQLEAQATAVEGGPGDPIERAINAYLAFGLDNPDAYRIAFMLEGLHTEAEDLCIDTGLKPGVRAFDSLRRAVALRLGADHPDLEVTAQSLWAAMHGLVSLLLARSSFPWIDQQELISWHVQALLKGVPPGGNGASCPGEN